MPHSSNQAVAATSRAALSALTCLRAFPRLRQRALPPQSQSPRLSGGFGVCGGVPTRYPLAGARRWVGSAAALAVREEEDAEDVGMTRQLEGSRSVGLSGNLEERVKGHHAVDPERLTVLRGDQQPEGLDLLDQSLSALDSRMAKPSRLNARTQFKQKPPRQRPTATGTRPVPSTSTRTATPETAARNPSAPEGSTSPSTDAPSSTRNRPTEASETDEIVWDTEYILDQALESTFGNPRRNTRARHASRGLPWPTRHLRLRTVRPVDVEFAENAFNQARRRLSELAIRDMVDPLHRDVLMAHINHMLYLSARVPDMRAYGRIKAYLRAYDLEPDSHTYLTQLILMDKMNQMNQLPGICRSFNQRRVSDDRQGRQVKKGKTIDGEDATVLLNMTLWMLAKRAQWNIVGPAYNKLLIHTPHATKHMSSAFPPDYFTPSHDLSFNLYFRNSTALNKITYQSLIRALAFHGNIVPALAVMQDLLNDSRGYTVAPSDFIALFQGFARFGRIPVGWEDLDMSPADAVGEDVYADSMAPLRPDAEEVPAAGAKTGKPQDQAMFPPPIFPEPSRPGSSRTGTSKMDALKQMTEIWAGKINTWEQAGGSTASTTMPTRLEREWTLVTLQQVFQSFLAISPVFDSPRTPSPHDTVSAGTSTKWWESSLAEAPSPRSIYYIMLAFSRTTDGSVPVLRAVWQHLEEKFGEGNEEGWTGWRLDARLRRLKEWLAAGK